MVLNGIEVAFLLIDFGFLAVLNIVVELIDVTDEMFDASPGLHWPFGLGVRRYGDHGDPFAFQCSSEVASSAVSVALTLS